LTRATSFTYFADDIHLGGLFTKIAAILLLVLFVICISASSALVKEVTVSGSSTAMPLVEAAAEVFNTEQHNYAVAVTAGGTGAGIMGIAERKFNIAMASREVTADEGQRYGDKFQEFKIGLDGICIAVSERIYQAGVKSLSREQVKAIYSGKITNWKDLGGPDEEIYVIAREDGSGTRDTFNEEIFGSKDAETSGVDTVAMGSAEVKTAIAGSDKAIGYLGFNYLGGGVKAIAFDGIMPTYDNIKLDLYELHRHLYLYTFGEPSPGASVFIEFVQGPEGQRIAEEQGFIPA
jgi:phosphate transport system substrate-binding protein